MTPRLTINPKLGKFAPRTVKIQGAVLIAMGLLILGLLIYGAMIVGAARDPLGATTLHVTVVWLALLGLVMCVVGVDQTLTGMRRKSFVIVLGVMFALTIVGAWGVVQILQ